MASSIAGPADARTAMAWRALERVPAPALFGVSAIFHYLGPALAVLLFARVDVLGVAWLRIVTAALVLAVWRRPWRLIRSQSRHQWSLLLRLGAVLALMNISFYLAIARLPLATVGAIEFLGVVALAALGVRTWRNLFALLLAVAGVAALADVRLAGEPVGFAFAFANLALFIGYVVLGHKIATDAATAGGGSTGRGSAGPAAPQASRRGGVDQLAGAMLVGALVATPFGVTDAAVVFPQHELLLAGIGVGVCSSVIPYVIDQIVMVRLRRATFALMLSILPASATVIGMVVLAQVPTAQDLLGVAMVIVAIATHQTGPPHVRSQREESQ